MSINSFNKNNLMKGAILVTVAWAALGLEAHAEVPNFHGKWRGECKTKDSTGAEVSEGSRLKIVQYGSIELKINGSRYNTDQENSLRSRLLGTGRLKIETSCQFLTSEQVSGLPGPFPQDASGGFACSTEAQVGLRGVNSDVATSSVMILVLEKDGGLTRLQGIGEQQESVELCRYRRE